ncbi:uncharacterized protein VP01_2426g2 [Puccinia sorghi]|uniref:Uncharacterized protein n=1 Tax=Puccinia sorghi TaxID=27349 RepID=A0A0L6V6F5_9BASI|nr:uncharacterized protein VP01_2426g2 [Puccinia sorghi]
MSTAWRQVKTLDDKMAMAAEAAAQLDLLAQLPSDSSNASPYRPLSSTRQLPYTPPAAHSAPQDPNAMEIDAVQALPRSLLDSSRILCRARNLCFRCLRPIVPGTHVGSLNCPNPPATGEQRKFLLPIASSSSSHSVFPCRAFSI